MPGLYGSGSLYKYLEVELKNSFPNCNITTVSYPSTGNQSFETLIDYAATKLSDENNYLISESFSGVIALSLAEKFKEKVKAVVLGASFIRPPVPSILKSTPLSFFLGIKAPRIILRYVLTGPMEKTIFQESCKVVDDLDGNIGAERVRNVLSLNDSFKPQIDCPVLYIRGIQDYLVPKSAYHKIKDIYPNLDYAEVEAGHLVYQAKPKECLEIIKNFLN